jgi:hypothetical protein
MRRQLLLLLLVSLFAAASATAQDGRVFAGVGGLWSNQPSGTPCQGSSCARPAVGGTSLGIVGEFGVVLIPGLDVALEASLPLTRFEGVQITAIPGIQRDSRHRDAIVSGLLHIEVPQSGPVRAGFVGGLSAVQEDTLQREASGSFGSTNFGPYGPEMTSTRWTFGLTAGGDVAVAVAQHVVIVPQIRVHWVDRASPGDAAFMLALGSVVVRPAVGVRVAF